MENMEIWDAVKKTDPKYTKNAKLKGGFNITAINATYQAMQMTKQFGAYGLGWGLEDVNYHIERLSDDPHDSVLVFKAILFYWLDGKKGIIPIDAELDIWEYSRKYKSWSKNNDMHKKVKTDAMTKGFSLLGLSADVFMGLYDDNKYINEVRHEFEEKKPIDPEVTARNDIFAIFKSNKELTEEYKNKLIEAMKSKKRTYTDVLEELTNA